MLSWRLGIGGSAIMSSHGFWTMTIIAGPYGAPKAALAGCNRIQDELTFSAKREKHCKEAV